MAAPVLGALEEYFRYKASRCVMLGLNLWHERDRG